MLKTILGCTTRRTLKQMSYSGRRRQRVPLLSAMNRKLRPHFTLAHLNWTIEDWRNVGLVWWVTISAATFGSILPCKDALGPLVPIEHRLHTTSHMSIVAGYVHPFLTTVKTSRNGYFQQDDNVSQSSSQTGFWYDYTQIVVNQWIVCLALK